MWLVEFFLGLKYESEVKGLREQDASWHKIFKTKIDLGTIVVKI